MRYPLSKPSFDEQENEAVRRVLASGWVVQGPEVEAFEKTVAALHGAKHGIAVANGTAALHLCYLAAGIGPGDAVFIPSFAWPSAANMAALVGARPVFVDVDPGTYNLDLDDLRRQIAACRKHGWGTPKAVVPVHEFGLAADLDGTLAVAKEHGLVVIEDAACALGTTWRGKPVGTFGLAAIFSFHPRKSVTTGEGGVIITDDPGFADRCRCWRNHGQVVVPGGRDFQVPGLNYRLTEIQGAIGRVQLEKFPRLLERRRALAEIYLQELAGCPGIRLPDALPGHAWQTLMVVLEPGTSREALMAKLAPFGIGAGPGSVAGHSGQVFREKFGLRREDLPVSQRLADAGLALPLYGDMPEEDVRFVAQTLRRLLQPS